MANPNIFQQLLQPPKSVAEYGSEYDKADMSRLALENQRGQNALLNITRQQQVQTSQQAQAKMNAIQALANDPAMRAPAAREEAMLNHPLLSADGQAMRKSRLDAEHVASQTRKETSTADKNSWEVRSAQADKAIRDVARFESPQAVVDDLRARVAAGQLPQATADQVMAGLPTDLAAFPAWQLKTQRSVMNAHEQELVRQKDAERVAPKPVETRLGDRVAFVDTNPNSPTYKKEVTSAAIGQSADNAATNQTSRANNAATVGVQARGQNISAQTAREGHAIQAGAAGLNPDGSPLVDGGGVMKPEAIVNAAARYNHDGTLPPNMGRGVQGAKQTAQVLNEAARQAAERGDNPQAQRIVQVANKASSGALLQLTKQEQAVGAFEKNALKNLDIALETSAQVSRTGVPVLNRWLLAGRKEIMGDPDVQRFHVANETFVNEYAKIMSGSMGNTAVSDSLRKEVHSLLATKNTPAQYKAATDVMKREMANRMVGFDEQKKQLRDGMLSAPNPAAASAPKTPVNPAISSVKSDADYNALPSGARFQAPDGTVRVKP